MSETILPSKKEKETEQPDKNPAKVRIEDDVAFWLNKTKSGKGVIIVIEDQAFISSLKNVQEFVDGTRRGVKFNHLKPAED